jgi:predicted kinase
MTTVPSPEQVGFLPIGPWGSVPADLYERLANHYDAVLHSTETARDRVGPDWPGWEDESDSDKGEGFRDAVRAKMVKMVTESLDSGLNVVYDGFVNHFEQRQEIRRQATPIGVRVVGLVFGTGHKTIEQRIIRANQPDATRQEKAVVPAYVRRKPLAEQIKDAQNMRRNVQQPDSPWAPASDSDFVILNANLDPGDIDFNISTRLLAEIAEHLGL